jgi:hypothetical protein
MAAQSKDILHFFPAPLALSPAGQEPETAGKESKRSFDCAAARALPAFLPVRSGSAQDDRAMDGRAARKERTRKGKPR